MTVLPPLVVHILRAAAIGAGIGATLALTLVATDAAGVGTLISTTTDPLAPLLLLILGFSTLIGSLYAGSSIMLLPRDAADPTSRWLDDAS